MIISKKRIKARIKKNSLPLNFCLFRQKLHKNSIIDIIREINKIILMASDLNFQLISFELNCTNHFSKILIFYVIENTSINLM